MTSRTLGGLRSSRVKLRNPRSDNPHAVELQAAQVLVQADPPHPVEQHHERADGQNDEQWNDADLLGNELHLAEKERAGRDEQAEAHPPEMTRQPSRSLNAAGPDHPGITDRGEQDDRGHEEHHSGRHMATRCRLVVLTAMLSVSVRVAALAQGTPLAITDVTVVDGTGD